MDFAKLKTCFECIYDKDGICRKTKEECKTDECKLWDSCHQCKREEECHYDID